MRIDIVGQGGYGAGGISSNGGIVNGPLILPGDPVNPLEACTKQYVDKAASSLNASNITTGTISINVLPAFTGDFSSIVGSNSLTLNSSGVSAGSYTKVTVDNKGRVTSGGYLTNADIPEFDWSKITSGKPTTLAGYGITDGVNPAGDNVTGFITLKGDPTTAYQLATKQYVDSLTSVSGGPIKVGDTIRRTSVTTPSGYLRCNGGSVSKTTYSALYAVVGDSYNFSTQPCGGQPWRQQYAFNKSQTSDITSWTTGTSLPETVVGSQAIVTSGRVYLLGGTINGDDSSTVYTAPINSDGTLGTWTTGTSLPGTVAGSQAIVTSSRVYLLGGNINGNYSSTVYTAPINSDGTLGTWTTGTSLPGAVTGSQAIVTSSRVYLLGGYNGSDYSSMVYASPINPDGTLGTWTTGTSLPGAVGDSQAIVTSSRVYLLGGFNGNYSSTVYTAPINPDGTLGSWTTGTSLPGEVCASQAIVTSSRVYLLGVIINNNYSNTVYTAPINPDGTLGTWTTGTSLPGTVAYSQAIVTSSRVYLLGGFNGSGYISTVYTAPFYGGSNDYSPYYNGTITTTDPANFRLPDTTLSDPPGIYTYIKH